MAHVFKKKYEVTYRDTNVRQECNLSAYMEFMVDAAFCQEATLGLSISDLIKSNHTWVIYDYKIKIHKYANYRDKLNVVTYVKRFKKFYAIRIFEIYDESNTLIVEGETLAFFIDMIKVRPCIIPKYYYELYCVEEDNKEPIKKLKLKAPEKITHEKEFEIRYGDIDLNLHVGNVQYVKWIMETIPFEVMTNYRNNHIKIKYEKEIKYGEKIRVQTQIEKLEDKIVAMHQIIDKDDKEIALLESHWEEINDDKNFLENLNIEQNIKQ